MDFLYPKARERVVQDAGQTTELCSRSGDREGGCPLCKRGELLQFLVKPLFFSNHINSHSFIDKVRKANKLLGTLSGSVDQLPSKKMYSGQQIDDQKAR